MLIFLALLYFCLATAAIWLALFPSGRALLGRGLFMLRQRWSRRALGWQIAGSRYAGAVRGELPRDIRGNILRFIRRHRIACAVGVPAILIPSLLALALSSPAMLPVYEGKTAAPDVQVAALLQGEAQQLGTRDLDPDSHFASDDVDSEVILGESDIEVTQCDFDIGIIARESSAGGPPVESRPTPSGAHCATATLPSGPAAACTSLV